jgi:hypothetical protein
MPENEREGWMNKLRDMYVDGEDNVPIKDFKTQENRRLSPPKLQITFNHSSKSVCEDEFIKKINQYSEMCDEYIAKHPNVYEFWKLNHSKFPLLARVARKVLGIPCSSAAVERVFSQTGYILRPHRRQINDKNTEYLFFLKCNAELFNWPIKNTVNSE